MGETRSVSVELSAEALQALESRVESGDYPSIAAAIEAAARLLEQQDEGEDFERWIDVEITERLADVERGDALRPADRVFSDLRTRHMTTRSKAG